MGEKRKPDIIILLKKPSKKGSNKVEFFKSSKFGIPDKGAGVKVGQRYRLRVNGKWWDLKGKKFFYKSELRLIVFKSIGL